jgi:hypothetical protein
MKRESKLLVVFNIWLILLTLFIFTACKHSDDGAATILNASHKASYGL